VLLGQGYRTPRGAVTDEYGAVVEIRKNSENNLLQCHLVHLESHPALNPGLVGEKTASNRLSYGTAWRCLSTLGNLMACCFGKEERFTA
jgi:hypothetical protein